MSELESGPNRDEVKSRLRSRANVGVISGQVLWPGTVKVLRDALAVIEAQEKEIARLKSGFHSAEQVMEHYVPGYVQTCESCGGPTRLHKFEALP